MTSQNSQRNLSNTHTLSVTVEGPDKDDYFTATALGAKGVLSCTSRSPNVAVAYVLADLSKEYLTKDYKTS